MIDIKIYQTIPHYKIRGEWSQNVLPLYKGIWEYSNGYFLKYFSLENTLK